MSSEFDTKFFDSPVLKKQTKAKKLRTREKVYNNWLHYRQEENTSCGKTEEINARLETFQENILSDLHNKGRVSESSKRKSRLSQYLHAYKRAAVHEPHDTDPKAS